MKSFKEQADELIKLENELYDGIYTNEIRTLIKAGEYFLELINVPLRCDENSFFEGIEEIEESITKLKETIK